jgi:hypothetical protein
METDESAAEANRGSTFPECDGVAPESLPLVLTLKHMIRDHTVTFCYFKIDLNVTLTSAPRS